MAPSQQLWSPERNGLSLSGLELFWIDPIAFEIQYLRNLEAVEPWNKNMSYGTLVQAGIEGFIKTRQPRGASKFIQTEYEKQVSRYEDYDEIAWWAGMANKQVEVWIKRYAEDLDTYKVTKSEEHHKVMLTLPSGRQILLHGYVDGEGEDIFMENKCRSEYNEESIAREIDMNLQVNFYLLLFKARYDHIPSRIWYQHIRRPGGWGYRGPSQKKSETREEYRQRLADHMNAEQDYHFYRYWIRPDEQRFERFLHGCLYPKLEAFLDWYTYMTHPNRKEQINRYHWMTPYGLYNPFTEGTPERFRNYRLTGSTMGLRPRLHHR